MPLKLVLNGRFLVRPVTGVERLAIELTRAIRAVVATRGLGDDIDIVVPSATGDQHEKVASFGPPVPSIMPVGRLDGHAWEQIELPKVAPKAWLLNFCNIAPMTRMRQAVVICDAQFVLHPESYSWAFRTWYRVVLTVVARRAAAVFTISEFSKGQLERFGIVPKGKAHVLKLGVDHLNDLVADDSVLERCGLRSRPYVLAIGSLARHKNLPTLIDAFIAANLPGVDLVVAGGSNARVFHDAGLREADNVRYIGRVSDGELKALYGNALAFACPSLSEGFGFTPLEAMTTGCPVIATTGGAVPEVCGDAAIYADPHNQAAWEDALRRIVTDAGLRADLAERAGRRAQQFVWRDTAVQMLTVLATQDGDQAALTGLA